MEMYEERQKLYSVWTTETPDFVITGKYLFGNILPQAESFKQPQSNNLCKKNKKP